MLTPPPHFIIQRIIHIYIYIYICVWLTHSVRRTRTIYVVHPAPLRAVYEPYLIDVAEFRYDALLRLAHRDTPAAVEAGRDEDGPMSGADGERTRVTRGPLPELPHHAVLSAVQPTLSLLGGAVFESGG